MKICDAHCDTLYTLHTRPGQPVDVTLDRLAVGGVSLQTLAMYVGPDPRADAVDALFKGMLAQLEGLREKGLSLLDRPGDAREGLCAAILSIEGCEVFEKGIETIAEYRRIGVRMASVTWNHENALGYPALGPVTQGLKPFGLRAVREMQRLGIAVDVSHLNEAGFYDVLHKSDAPPLASHSCCRALRDHPRNLSNRQLKALFEAGGFVGVNFYPVFLTEPGARCTLDTVVDHIDHMYQLGGHGRVGFGSDFDGIEVKPEGLDNPSDFPALVSALERRGFGPEPLTDIAGEALLRYFDRIS